MTETVTLSEPQNSIFNRIILSISRPFENPNGNVFMVKGAAGTGKTFLMNQIAKYCESNDVKSIAIAYTGIASCILLKGKTVHSQFRIPWTRQPIACAIESTYPVYKTIQNASVLLWDQAAFCSKQIFEEVDRFLQTMMNSSKLFGGKVVVMCADFHECIPIAAKTSEPLELQSILFSPLINKMQHFKLADNFRFSSPVDFRWCLDIGSGALNNVHVPNECRVYNFDTLLNSVYGNYSSLSVDDVMKRTIITIRDVDVNYLNIQCLNRFFPTKFVCKSINYFRKIDEDRRSRFYVMDDIMEDLPKYFPPDIVVLTENCPIMLRQTYRGLAPGTRLIVREISERKIIAEIGVGERKGKTINIYRVLTKKVFWNGNVEFIRRQFPVSLAFSITIHKAQGLQFDQIGVHFPCAAFTHGQMYVAFSRVPDIRQNAKVLVTDVTISHDRLPNIVNPNILAGLNP